MLDSTPDGLQATPTVHPSARPLMRLMRAAGVDPKEFCEAFEETFWPEQIAEAAAIDAHFRAWLAIHEPQHPFLGVRLITAPEALQAAGIKPGSGFSTEGFAPHYDQGRPEEHAKWVNWLKNANALHREGWGDDHIGFVEDICRAIDAKASILVSARWG